MGAISEDVIADFMAHTTAQERTEVTIVAASMGLLNRLNDGLRVPLEESMLEIAPETEPKIAKQEKVKKAKADTEAAKTKMADELAEATGKISMLEAKVLDGEKKLAGAKTQLKDSVDDLNELQAEMQVLMQEKSKLEHAQ